MVYTLLQLQGDAQISSIFRPPSGEPPVESSCNCCSRRRKAFKFEEMWLRSPECQMVVSKARNSDCERGNQHQHKFLHKIECATNDLHEWANKNFGALAKKITAVECDLAELRNKAPTSTNYQEIQHKKQKVLEWKNKEIFFWKQRSRILWLKEGDINTKVLSLLCYLPQKNQPDSETSL